MDQKCDLKFIWVLLLLSFTISPLLELQELQAQALFSEPLRKIIGRKREIYFKEGIFFKHGATRGKFVLQKVRQFYNPKLSQERIVFDFAGEELPQIYSYIASADKKLYIDFFSTSLNPAILAFGNGHFVKNLYFYPIGKDLLSVEIDLSKQLPFEAFYLEKPGRLVIDIRP